MKTKLWIPALLAAATLSTSAFAHGGDRERNYDRDDYRARQEYRDHRWRNEQWRREQWRREQWRREHRSPYAYGYDAPPPRYYERPAVYLPLPPLPPPPHVILHDILRGR